MKKFKYILLSLSHHLPFSVLSVSIGLIFVGILNFIVEILEIENPTTYFEELFHIFHPSHILFSALATTTMFWKHEKKFLKAFIIGIIGSAGICGISDIFMPYISGFLLGAKMELHICIIQHPQIILPFLFLGVFVGYVAPETLEKSEGVIFSHSLHVFISAIASIFYLISFGLTEWTHQIGSVLIYMVLAVIIPCCASDIIFPLFFISQKSEYKHFH
ncbi:MAG: hypothetical protein NC816_03330 [Candidatus Omnitrophica bacterium]|nr:hypothetical protein [Candidatus Omnitrophota bacterium]MCM8810807.1 hypothetical protein [Candidatus Omnitrophota bacterium]MCM8832938.1 hypothetical protein [Candidatus Omnitrophota bacterium]